MLERVEQRGKFLTLDFGADRIVVNAMLTGRLGLAAPGRKAFSSTALVLTFGAREALPPDVQRAGWTDGADWLPADDAAVELRYRDPRKMGKVYLLPAGVEREVAGWDALGPDADDAALDLATWQARIKRHNGELQNLLKNQEFVAGIGNAYSDEILWAARVAPFRKRASLGTRGIGGALAGRPRGLCLGHRRAAGTRATDVREAGSRLPAGPPQGRRAVSALRGHPERGLARWLHHQLVPFLPVLRAGAGLARRRSTAAMPR